MNIQTPFNEIFVIKIMTKIDLYKNEQRYKSWKEKINEISYIEGISKTNSNLIIRYIFDMELEINVSNVSVKGSRGYSKLNNLKQRMAFLTKKIEEVFNLKKHYKLTRRTNHFFLL